MVLLAPGIQEVACDNAAREDSILAIIRRETVSQSECATSSKCPNDATEKKPRFPRSKQDILEMLRYIHSLAFLCFVLNVVQSKCVSLAGACRNTRD